MNLLIEKTEKSGLHWLDDVGQRYDEYVVEVGRDIEELPILPIIREQIVLNCNSAFPGENAQVEPCQSCKDIKFSMTDSAKVKSEIDPRWEKLRELLKK